MNSNPKKTRRRLVFGFYLNMFFASTMIINYALDGSESSIYIGLLNVIVMCLTAKALQEIERESKS